MLNNFLFRNILLLLLLLTSTFCFAGDYEDAWLAFNQNDRTKAEALFKKAMKNPQTAIDAYLSYMYVLALEDREDELTDFSKMIYDKAENPYPYIYSLWHKSAVTGGYDKKSDKSVQSQLLDRLEKDPKASGSLKASAHYVRAMSILFGGNIQASFQEKSLMGGIQEWQYVGPFDNSSESGFDKNYGPLEHPEPTAVFTSSLNSEIKWFTPKYFTKEGWVYAYPHIVATNSVIYMQTFLNSPSDIDAYICAGGYGSMKIWVNDQQIISEAEEIQTELDIYKNKCRLNKGYNRVLIQLGYNKTDKANFILRVTDENQNLIPNIKVSPQNQPYTPNKEKVSTTSIKHFAEAYFEDKVKKEPNNLLGHILLAETYLRNEKGWKAREVVENALTIAPNNSILLYLLTRCLGLSRNRTELSKTYEKLKENEKGKVLGYLFELREQSETQNYAKALELLEKKGTISKKDEEYYSTKIQLLAANKQVEDMLKTIAEAFAKFPTNKTFLRNAFSVRKQGYKDNKGAIALLENYLKKNFDFGISQELAQEYFDMGNKVKGFETLEKLYAAFPWDPDLTIEIGRHYFDEQNYDKALKYCAGALDIAPYCAVYHHNLAMIYMQKGDSKEAEKYLTQSLQYDANRYDSQRKLRELKHKEPIETLFPKTDINALIAESMKNTPKGDFNYSLIAEEINRVVYPEGGQETYYTFAIKVLNKQGVERFKEYQIGFNQYSESLNIEKAEVIKKSGGKVQAETEENMLVFTNLEPEDVVFIKYKIQHYYHGKISKDFMDNFSFDSFIPIEYSRYSLLVADKYKFDYKMVNSDLKPEVKEVENFKLYVWEKRKIAEIKDEPYMPELCDFTPTLFISSLKSWDDVANWYSDLAYSKTQEDYEVRKVYEELFADKKGLSELAKAKIIYEYILKNIRYSSISFRQSSYVPQKASKTIATQLGDCKDLSSLFVALGKLAGLETRLVLVNTRDNGLNNMILPSINFNHCIVKLTADGKVYYLELTDNVLPFGSLPSSLYQASILEIPRPEEKASSQLQSLKPDTRTLNQATFTMKINLDKNDLKINANFLKIGSLTTNLRYNLAGKSQDKQKEYVQKIVADNVKNTVTIQNTQFGNNLNQLADSLSFEVDYTIKNEVIEVGEMSMFRLPILDVIATLERFPEEKRNFAFEYWQYETIDVYNNTYIISLPAGKVFTELPADVSLSANGNTYSLKYEKLADNQLKVTRKAQTNRDNISAEKYPDFKEFIEKLIKAETKYIAFK